ncbi:hypothetical protein [Microvirga pudoricolor]|uniref:hypothetical protein n=1 Tax=Microvirga pudoricolor TaxID=2778729 RepID=UPI0019502059|nr:hypothetical protein [Microvirga pudoricolor]MBM6594011.1 hypothetical protein [Microvirga pudoricolor]
MSKKLINSSKDASWARLPVMDSITVLQAQFFDNRSVAARVKGKSDFALKLFAWTSGWNIDLKKPEWWRVVQLVDPKTVLTWAKKKHEANGMDAEMLSVYSDVSTEAMKMQQSGHFELVKMGHVSSPPGTQYFVGQFVFIARTEGGVFSGFVYNDGAHVELEGMKPTKKAGVRRKSGTPTHAAILKGQALLNWQREAREKEANWMSQQDHLHPLNPPQIDPQIRAFINGSPF